MFFRPKPVIDQHFAVIGGKDNQRIVVLPSFLQEIDDTAECSGDAA